MKKPQVNAKYCIRCGKILPLADFYVNKAWAKQKGRDAWCKDCAAKYCKDMETVRQYCFDNNRLWREDLWDTAVGKAQYILSTNADYLNPKTSPEKKKKIENETAVRQFFGSMNWGRNYVYVDNIGADGEPIPDPPTMSDDSNRREYSRKWGGCFTKEEIETLEETYAQYEEDFVLDNVSMRDYARKVAKASLNADIAEDKMRRGEISAGEYKEAQRVFDDLSKSSNFAACRRKPGDASGMGSLGEIILRLETSGALKENGFTFPEDDIDKIIRDFRQTLRSVGIDGQL